jgi:branched-chain amino acid transport system ATP-binding protein
MLKVDCVTQQFGGLTALAQVSLQAEAGNVTGLIGPNGAGKTTLINGISGLYRPTSGNIYIDSVPVQRLPPHQIARLGVARTYQNIRLFGEMSARDNLILAQHRHGQSSIAGALLRLPAFVAEQKAFAANADALLAQFGLSDKAEVLAAALPYGDQRRVEMARALATRPRLVLLDEPTAGMNPVEKQELGNHVLAMRKAGIAVLVIEHDIAFIRQVCDTVYVLNFGQIIATGTPDAIRNNPRVIEAYLGEEA